MGLIFHTIQMKRILYLASQCTKNKYCLDTGSHFTPPLFLFSSHPTSQQSETIQAWRMHVDLISNLQQRTYCLSHSDLDQDVEHLYSLGLKKTYEKQSFSFTGTCLLNWGAMRSTAFCNRISWENQVRQKSLAGTVTEWPSLPIYNLISDYTYGNEEADFQRPTQGWAWFSISSKSTVFETQPTDEDDKSLSHKPGLVFQQVHHLMITSLMFDKTRRLLFYLLLCIYTVV